MSVNSSSYFTKTVSDMEEVFNASSHISSDCIKKIQNIKYALEVEQVSPEEKVRAYTILVTKGDALQKNSMSSFDKGCSKIRNFFCRWGDFRTSEEIGEDLKEEVLKKLKEPSLAERSLLENKAQLLQAIDSLDKYKKDYSSLVALKDFLTIPQKTFSKSQLAELQKEEEHLEEVFPRGVNDFLVRSYLSKGLLQEAKNLVEEDHTEVLAYTYLKNGQVDNFLSIKDEQIKRSIALDYVLNGDSLPKGINETFPLWVSYEMEYLKNMRSDS
jgi:hypothetical protein